MVELRPMTIADVALLRTWDDDADVAAALGGRGADWYDWPIELARAVPWRELLIVTDVVDRHPRVDNQRAIRFYRRLGFVGVEEREFDGDRCLVMTFRPSAIDR